jgi:hypothetical protein
VQETPGACAAERKRQRACSPRGRLVFGAVCLPFLFASAGCDDEIQQTVASVKGTVTTAVETVTERVAGSIELRLKPPVKLEACHAHFSRPAGGRPAVLQMGSYPELKQEKFPSVFIYAQVDASTPDKLAGAKIRAQLFVQHEQGGPVWHSRREEPVTLLVTEATGQYLVCSVAASKVYSTETDESFVISGKISGRIK